VPEGFVGTLKVGAVVSLSQVRLTADEGVPPLFWVTKNVWGVASEALSASPLTLNEKVPFAQVVLEVEAPASDTVKPLRQVPLIVSAVSFDW
jgi:hypothetical protein